MNDRHLPLVEIYRSHQAANCAQRAFVLHAVGIPSETARHENIFVLLVSEYRAAEAREQLERYEAESPAPTAPPAHMRPHAWVAPLLLVAAVIVAGHSADTLAFGADWYDIGALHSRVMQSGEWWRLLTALTLHADVAHLLGNVVFGVFFTFVAAQLVGSGVAWCGIVFTAALGNLVDSQLMPVAQTSIGASTAVFAALGLISGYAWRHRHDARLKWAHRSAPLVAGIVLLGLIGAGGEHTDVLAHLAGFACGTVCGITLASCERALDRAKLQWLAGAVASVAMTGAWIWALVIAR